MRLGLIWTLDGSREEESCDVLWPFIVVEELAILFDTGGGIVIVGGAEGLASIGFTGLVFDGVGEGKDGISDFADGGSTYDEWTLGMDGIPVFFPVRGRWLFTELHCKRV